MALAAYRNAERMMAVASPGCGISWNLLAGIGRIESMHAYGGATDSRGLLYFGNYGQVRDRRVGGDHQRLADRSAELRDEPQRGHHEHAPVDDRQVRALAQRGRQ